MKTKATLFESCIVHVALLFFVLGGVSKNIAYCQSVMFDFNTAPVQTSLPANLTVGGITAHFTATGSGYSFQQANVLGFTPAGFDGISIYPNSVFAADLLISFDQTLTDFAIMYSPQELGCDDSATMRVTAYMNTTLVGTNTATVPNPGTWPTGTLSCTFPSGFNNVVVHYANHPPTCQDYGVIFMADNMQVTPLNLAVDSNTLGFSDAVVSPNPITQNTILSFTLSAPDTVNATLYDLSGKTIATMDKGNLESGTHIMPCEWTNLPLTSGLYLLKVSGEHFTKTLKVVVVK